MVETSLEVTLLSWDSDFFGIPVGALYLPSVEFAVESIESAIRVARCKLTYVFLPVDEDGFRNVERIRSVIVRLGGRCCDLKLTYRKNIGTISSWHKDSVPLATTMTPTLESLTYASGWCSRFYTDDRLRPFFKPLYRRWLKRELMEGKVFVLPSAERPEGMTTVAVRDGIGKIGLVAVDAGSCRMGLASALLRNVDAWLFSQAINVCEVVTQGINVSARRLYEKNGFCLHSQVEVWHVWNDQQ